MKIISGGQTGADRGGWLAAKHLGLETGGTMPKGYKAEDGNHPEFAALYGAEESPSSSYPNRTSINVANSNGTVIFGNDRSLGSRATKRCCKLYNKPWFPIALPVFEHEEEQVTTDFLNWIRLERITVLNVAGNRESHNPGIQEEVTKFLIATLNGKTKDDNENNTDTNSEHSRDSGDRDQAGQRNGSRRA